MATFEKKNLDKIKEMERSNPKHTILIVDDEPMMLTSLASLLSDEYNVLIANDGQEALEIIERIIPQQEISLIISDQRMKKITGVELFKKLVVKSENEISLRHTIRIILTGFIDIPIILGAINDGKIYEFIQKPFNPDDFLIRVRRAIESYEWQKALDNCCQTLKKTVDKMGRQLKSKDKEIEILTRKVAELKAIIRGVSEKK
jgi:DNA-binding NtrC family response regulator